MTDAPDAELLERFARDNSETAFAALVERHLGLVHSVALRHTVNPQHAQDITQAVFIILAKKANRLARHTVLPGWLYHTARLTAANFQRAETRRIRREQEAYMQSTLNEAETANAWTQMSPLLDEAMSHLSASDRDALVLRYFQNKSLPEVGAAMGLAERAAQKRVLRAIERLRKFFVKRGVTPTAATIAETISTHSIQVAPIGLVAIISKTAISGKIITTAAMVAATKAIAMTTLQKTAITVALVVTIGTGVFEAHQSSQLRAQNQTLQQQQASLTAQVEQLQRDHSDATNQVAALLAENMKLLSTEAELLKLRDEIGLLRRQASELKSSQDAQLKNDSNLIKSEPENPDLAMLEVSLLQDKTDLTNKTQNIEQLAIDLNVPNEIIKNVYAYTNVTDGSLNAYQPYIDAVMSRDRDANFILLLETKIAAEKALLQNKQLR
ncbi:MAG TPA: sigma-70 family RNA polymerase sigma factor [Candidatus Baltobacteraceae bacterium]|nr:sigma-70 family RNA polymerase sigma factor [Candidatus Baltobacteraceae bacterium]